MFHDPVENSEEGISKIESLQRIAIQRYASKAIIVPNMMTAMSLLMDLHFLSFLTNFQNTLKGALSQLVYVYSIFKDVLHDLLSRSISGILLAFVSGFDSFSTSRSSGTGRDHLKKGKVPALKACLPPGPRGMPIVGTRSEDSVVRRLI